MARTPPALTAKRKDVLKLRETGTPLTDKIKDRVELATVLVKIAENQMKESGNLKTSIKNRLTEVVNRMLDIVKEQEEEKNKLKEEIGLLKVSGGKGEINSEKQIESLREEIKIIRGTTEKLGGEIGEIIMNALRSNYKAEQRAGGELKLLTEEFREFRRTTEQMRVAIEDLKAGAPLHAAEGEIELMEGGGGGK